VRAIGLMSGTSLDGVDAALVRFDGSAQNLTWTLERFLSVPYTAEQRGRIHDGIVAGTAEALCRLNASLGEWLAEAATALCSDAGIEAHSVDVIGSHGQTLWHQPPEHGKRGATLQLGCAATIAERTGIPVISDFRARDVAAGGHGAPLVPWADRWLFARAEGARVLQNIGGMANLTWVPARGSSEPLLAFDTGPGNALIDAAVQLATDGERIFDDGGAWADAGEVNQELLDELLAHPFFTEQPPKSTGREVFGRPFVEAVVARRKPESWTEWAALVATLTMLTTRTIARAIERWVADRGVAEVIVTGGGAQNPVLMRWLGEALAPLSVLRGDAVGIHPDAKEAIAFAGLAWAFTNGLPGNIPAATGANGPRVLGSFTPAPGRTLQMEWHK
jgi:anhydro-N-acetylmuramic acid kinase